MTASSNAVTTEFEAEDPAPAKLPLDVASRVRSALIALRAATPAIDSRSVGAQRKVAEAIKHLEMIEGL